MQCILGQFYLLQRPCCDDIKRLAKWMGYRWTVIVQGRMTGDCALVDSMRMNNVHILARIPIIKKIRLGECRLFESAIRLHQIWLDNNSPDYKGYTLFYFIISYFPRQIARVADSLIPSNIFDCGSHTLSYPIHFWSGQLCVTMSLGVWCFH